MNKTLPFLLGNVQRTQAQTQQLSVKKGQQKALTRRGKTKQHRQKSATKITSEEENTKTLNSPRSSIEKRPQRGIKNKHKCCPKENVRRQRRDVEPGTVKSEVILQAGAGRKANDRLLRGRDDEVQV